MQDLFTFHVGNRSFQIKTDESQAHLEQVADYVRVFFDKLKQKKPHLLFEQMAFWASFHFAGEWLKTHSEFESLKVSCDNLERRIAEMEREIQSHLSMDVPSSPALEAASPPQL